MYDFYIKLNLYFFKLCLYFINFVFLDEEFQLNKNKKVFFLFEKTTTTKFSNHFSYIKNYKFCKRKKYNSKLTRIIEYTNKFINDKLDIKKYFKRMILLKNLIYVLLTKVQGETLKKIGNFKINPKTRRNIESGLDKDPCKELEILLNLHQKGNLNETDIRIKKLIKNKFY